jgi:hypothetical protein
MKTLTNSKRLRFATALALLYGSFQFAGKAALPTSTTAPTDPAGNLPERMADFTMLALVAVVVVFVLVKILQKNRNQGN